MATERKTQKQNKKVTSRQDNSCKAANSMGCGLQQGARKVGTHGKRFGSKVKPPQLSFLCQSMSRTKMSLWTEWSTNDRSGDEKMASR